MSLYEVNVSTKNVLEIVKQNKQKHDKILSDAIVGFWVEAEKSLKQCKIDKLKELKKNYQTNVKNLKKQVSKELDFVSKKQKSGPFYYMPHKYPEDHSDDYNGVIRKLELSVDENVELDTEEFNRYIRNQWDWRNSFLKTNTSYYSSVSGSYAVSSSWSSGSVTSSYSSTPTCFGTSSWSAGTSYVDNKLDIFTSTNDGGVDF